AVLIYISQRALRIFGAWISKGVPNWWSSVRKMARAQRAIEESGPGLWLAIKLNPHPPDKIAKLQGLKQLILTIANLKGGVGKTTLTANLAAFFANPLNDPGRPKRRVLVVDLDFQGSCSSMLFAGTEWRPGEHQLSQASEVISGTLTNA